MGTNVVLVVPPFDDLYPGAQSPAGDRLGLGYLAAVLRQDGITTEMIHCPVQELSVRACAEHIAALAPQLVGISTLFSETDVRGALALAKAVKARTPAVHVSLGGHPATFAATDIMGQVPQVDSIARGEGELTMLELARRVLSGQAWRNLDGVVARQNGGLALNPSRRLVKDLDQLPFPARDLLHILPPQRKGFTMLTSRGCHHQCSYCSVHPFYRLSTGKVWRGRSPQNVVDEIEQLRRQWQFECIEFHDDNFTGPGRVGRERSLGIAKELIKRKINVSWAMECRADSVDEDLFAFLKLSGLINVCLGIETGTQGTLDLYNKRTTVEENCQALDILHRLGIDVRIGFIGFNPFTTVQDLRGNVEFFEQAGLMDNLVALSVYFSHLKVFRGTPIETLLEERDLLTNGMDGFGLVKGYRFLDPYVQVLADVAYQVAERPGRRLMMGDGFKSLQQSIMTTLRLATGLSGQGLSELLAANGLPTPEMIEHWRERSIRQAFHTFTGMLASIDDTKPLPPTAQAELATRLYGQMQAALESVDREALGMPFEQAVQRMRQISATQRLQFIHQGEHRQLDLLSLDRFIHQPGVPS